MFIKKVSDVGYGLSQVMHNSGHVDYRSKRTDNIHYVPAVVGEYIEDGVRMYECTGNRHFVADTYDRLFKAPKGELMPKNYKGDNSFYKKGR